MKVCDMIVQFLFDRIEKAIGSDRALDADIARAIGIKLTPVQYSKRDPWGKSDVWEMVNDTSALRYSASVDDAMTLIPQGCDANFAIRHNEASQHAQVLHRKDGNIKYGSGNTLPLAICSAALLAQEGLNQ